MPRISSDHLVASAFCFLAALASPLRATETLSVEEVARKAKRIVVATVETTEVRPGPASTPYTYTQFRIDVAVKGDLSGTFSTRIIGGKLDNVEVTPAFERPFTPGRQYVLFLGATNRDGFVTVSPALLLEVRQRRGGAGAAVDGPLSLPLFERATGKAYLSRPTTIPLEDLIHSLRRLNASTP